MALLETLVISFSASAWLPHGREKQCAWKTSAALHSQKTFRRISTTSFGRFHRAPSRCIPICLSGQQSFQESIHSTYCLNQTHSQAPEAPTLVAVLAMI